MKRNTLKNLILNLTHFTHMSCFISNFCVNLTQGKYVDKQHNLCQTNSMA